MSLLQRAVEWIRTRTDTSDTSETNGDTSPPVETPEPDEIRATQVFNISRDVDSNGAIYIPADARRTDEFGDLQENDVEMRCIVSKETDTAPLTPQPTGDWHGYINSGNRLTIPAEYRTELDISEGDTVTVSAVVEYDNE